MNIVPCGSRVTSKLNNVEGIVTGISIRFNTISYEISYFSGLDYKQIRMNECEFTFSEKKKQIGFQKY